MKFDFTSEEMNIIVQLIYEKIKDLKSDPLVSKQSNYLKMLINIHYRLENNG